MQSGSGLQHPPPPPAHLVFAELLHQTKMAKVAKNYPFNNLIPSQSLNGNCFFAHLFFAELLHQTKVAKQNWCNNLSPLRFLMKIVSGEFSLMGSYAAKRWFCKCCFGHSCLTNCTCLASGNACKINLFGIKFLV